jgi:hypothetical protein
MTEPWEWTEQDLLDLITNRTEENLNLDYKRKDSLANTDHKKNDISKDVSAFANSDGGTIVYGMEENNQLPVHLDGVNPTDTTREWIEQVINSKIHPRIDGIRINPVPLSTPLTGTVVVVYVPASPNAPHMASDNKYYKRYNFQSVPMEHYELEDVRRRKTGPLLSLALANLQRVRMNEVKLFFQLINSSPTMALYSRLLIKIEGGTFMADNDQWDSIQPYDHGTLLQKNLSVPARLPIWEGIPFTLGANFTISCADQLQFCTEWTIHSPEMLPQTGVYWFQGWNGTISPIEDPAVTEILNQVRAENRQGR